MAHRYMREKNSMLQLFDLSDRAHCIKVVYSCVIFISALIENWEPDLK